MVGVGPAVSNGVSLMGDTSMLEMLLWVLVTCHWIGSPPRALLTSDPCNDPVRPAFCRVPSIASPKWKWVQSGTAHQKNASSSSCLPLATTFSVAPKCLSSVAFNSPIPDLEMEKASDHQEGSKCSQ